MMEVIDLETLRYEVRGAGAWFVLTREKQMNALSPALIRDLADSLGRAGRGNDVRAVVITGTGNAFCAGADLKFINSLGGSANSSLEQFLQPLSDVLRTIRSFPKPVIAAVNGHCVAGGLETVLCCDLIFAGESALFSDGHARFGLLPAIGGAHGLVKTMGPFKAKEMLFTSKRYTAREMREAGLVNEVVPDDQLWPRVEELVALLAERSPSGLAAMKQMANDGLDESWDMAARHDLFTTVRHLNRPDPHEGIAAFNEKRRPDFGPGG